MEETSLEDFLDGGTTDEQGGSPTPEPAAADASAGDAPAADRAVETPAGGAEPPTVTAAWSPDGQACATCGARVAWRWGTETGLVCRDCKDW